MKKIQNPEVKLIKVSSNDILCSSPGIEGVQVTNAFGSYEYEEEEW